MFEIKPDFKTHSLLVIFIILFILIAVAYFGAYFGGKQGAEEAQFSIINKCDNTLPCEWIQRRGKYECVYVREHNGNNPGQTCP